MVTGTQIFLVRESVGVDVISHIFTIQTKFFTRCIRLSILIVLGVRPPKSVTPVIAYNYSN